ncbi:MAG: hypothetical protein EXQ47_06170, partial [Bryobacterales bacterium]|nr:hypothetical protein [Bryobacterales bacterium]
MPWRTSESIAARNAASVLPEPVGAAISVSDPARMAGQLLYAQAGTLMAAPFDAQRLALSGAAVPALEGMMQSITGAAQYSVSSTGTLAYLAGEAARDQSRLVWVSRNGEEQVLPAAPHNY